MSVEKLTSSWKKRLSLLGKRKYRLEFGIFAVEGEKAFKELAATGKYKLEVIVATAGWWRRCIIRDNASVHYFMADSKEMSRLSSLVSPPDVIGYFRLPEPEGLNVSSLSDKLTLVLDGIQDPGNLGTIIRLSDWWGVEDIICSSETADCYSPKVVQATMGALGRVNVIRTDSIPEVLRQANKEGLDVFGTFMDGKDVFATKLPYAGILIMGGEGRGISEGLLPFIGTRLTIPSYPPGEPHVESLNVATATAILLGQFRYGTNH